MEQNMENIDDFFKEELGSYAELPPPPAWGALEKRLDEEKKRRLFPYRWYWFISLVALMGITGLSVAWKMSANRESLAGGVPTFEQKSPAAASTSGNSTTSVHNLPATELASAAQVTHTTSIAKTTRHTSKRKHTAHSLSLASTHAQKISTQKTAALNQLNKEEETSSASSHSEHSSRQYDEDYYEGATASIAPTPAELSAPAGYSVNKRRRNNMLIADMTPKEEPATRYSAAPTEHVTSSVAVAEPTLETSAAQPAHRSAKIAHHVSQKKVAQNTVAAIQRKEIPSNESHTTVAAAVAQKPATVSAKQPNHNNTPIVAMAQKPSVAPSAAPSVAKTDIEHKTAKHLVNTHSASVQTIAAKTPASTNAKVATPTAALPTADNKLVKSATQTKAAKASTITKTERSATPVSVASINTSVPAKASQPKQPKTIALATAAPTKTSSATAAKTATKVIAEPAITSATIPATKAATEAKFDNKTSAPVMASAVATSEKPIAAVKQGKAATAMTPAHENVTSRVGKATTAELPIHKQPEAVVVNAAVPTAKAGRKTKTKAANKDNTITAVAALAGTQPAQKAAKSSGRSSMTAGTTSKGPVKGLSTPIAKQQAKTAGKSNPATNTYAASAHAAKTPAISKTSSPARAFGGNLSRFNEEEPPTEDPTINTPASAPVAAQKEETLPGTFKDKADANNPLTTVKNEEVKSLSDSTATAAKHSRFEAGIKAGFEGSYNGSAARKMVISPYFDYKLSNRFSILVQPSIKAANVQKKDLSGNQTFYSINHSDSTLSSTDPMVVIGPGGIVDTIATIRTYSYSQTHQEIKKSYSTASTYYEFEIPLLFKYAVTPKLAMYAGININYSRAIRVNENSFSSTIKMDSMFGVPTMAGQSISTPPALSSVFRYPGQPISNYAGPLYPTPTGGIFSLGYMLGFSYEFKKRWLADALVQQGFAKSNVMGGVDVNKPLTMPYIRLTLGYRLTK